MDGWYLDGGRKAREWEGRDLFGLDDSYSEEFKPAPKKEETIEVTQTGHNFL